MATSYPGGLDDFTNPTATDELDSVTVPHADQHANLNDAVEAIEAELGVDPAGGSATVVARLDADEQALSDHLTDTTDAHDASAVSVDATLFSGNLSTSDTDVQTAFDTLDAMSVGSSSPGGDLFLHSVYT